MLFWIYYSGLLAHLRPRFKAPDPNKFGSPDYNKISELPSNAAIWTISTYYTICTTAPIFPSIPTELEHLYRTIQISSKAARSTPIAARWPVVLTDLPQTNIVRSVPNIVIRSIQIAVARIADDAQTTRLRPLSILSARLSDVGERRCSATWTTGAAISRTVSSTCVS